jgi:hypothetical protein
MLMMPGSEGSGRSGGSGRRQWKELPGDRVAGRQEKAVLAVRAAFEFSRSWDA